MSSSLIATIVVAAILILFAFWGYHRGFLRLILTTMAFVVTVAAAGVLTPTLSSVVRDSFIGKNIEKGVDDFMQKNMERALKEKAKELQWDIDDQKIASLEHMIPVETNKELQEQIISKLPLPQFALKDIEEENTAEGYLERKVSGFTDYLEARISGFAINIATYVILMILIYLVIRILLRVFRVITKIPLIGGLNRLAGALVGLAEGLLIIWAACLLVMLIAHTSFGKQILDAIEGSAFLKFLYDNNGILLGANALFHTFL